MNRVEYLYLLSEKRTLESMISETPEEDVIDRASLYARLAKIEKAIAEATPHEREPARATVTFRGRPVVGSHGIFAEFAMHAVNNFSESVDAVAASLSAPLRSSGPIPDRGQRQLLITDTARNSFGFELEEHAVGQLTFEKSAVSQALVRMLSVLRGAIGKDEDLAEAIADMDRRALDKVQAFLETLVNNDAMCTVRVGDSSVTFEDTDQVRTGYERLSQNSLHEEQHEMNGELQGVLPDGRSFEFKFADSSTVVRGRIAPTITDPDSLNRELHKPIVITVIVRRVGSGRPQYLLVGTRPRS